MKFEDAYCASEKRVLPIYSFGEVLSELQSEYVTQYKDSLYCPECRKAKLTFVTANPPYFRTYPRAKHSDECSLAQEECSNNTTTELLSDRSSVDEIKRQLNSVMKILFSENVQTSEKKKEDKTVFKSAVKSSSNKHISKKPRIPRKRIDIPFREEDYNTEKIFYGDVFLRWKYYQYENCYRLLIYKSLDRTFRCSVKITMSVYEHIKDYERFDGRECKLAFIGKLTQSKNGFEKDNIGFATLFHSDYLKIYD